MRNDDESLQNLGALNFRNLISSLEDGDVSNDTSISFLQKDSDNIFVRVSLSAYRYLRRLSKNSNYSIFGFLSELLLYIGIRLRILMVLLSVISEVFSEYTSGIRRFIVKKMFWGRGSLFKLSVQFVSLVIIVVLFISSNYRLTPTSAQLLGVSVAGEIENQSDLIAIRGSTRTVKPEDRENVDTITYVVKVGDTLSKISYDNGISVQTILWANDLNTYSLIKPGQKLTLPPGDGVVVKVKKGDTIEKLAKTYKSRADDIIDVNKTLFPPFDLTAGQSIFIPNGQPIATPKPSTPVYSGVVASRPGSLQSSQTVSGVGRFLNWPVKGGRGSISRCYSWFHNGIDIADGASPELVATAPGTVRFAGCYGSCPPPGVRVGGSNLAWTVVIDHGNGLSSVYGHMNAIYVRNGQFVSGGQSIGQMGQSGTAYGTHVHFMLLSGGNWRGVNPAPYFKSHLCGY